MELIKVPKVAEAVTEGTVSLWHVSVGDRVDAGKPLVEMITEKAEDDVLSPAAGRVAAVYATERSTVPVGFVLCVLAEEGEDVDGIEEINAEVMRKHQAALMGELPDDEPVQVDRTAGSPRNSSDMKTRIPASPAARRLASDNGVELGDVASQLGIDSRISESHVREYLNRNQSKSS